MQKKKLNPYVFKLYDTLTRQLLVEDLRFLLGI